MSVAGFLADLFDSGRVAVVTEPLKDLEPQADPVLISAERVAALNLAGTAPPFSLTTARWAALLLYRACQCLVCRDLKPKTIAELLQPKCPEPHSPETDYSADLVLQFLPDIAGLARAVAPDDPLVQQLQLLAREWPLSSVGVPVTGPVAVDAFIGHAGLRQLYADRIIARGDVGRLGHPQVDAAVREALGAFPELCRPIADHFAKASAAVCA